MPVGSPFLAALRQIDIALITGEFSDTSLMLSYSEGIKKITGYTSAEISGLPGRILNIIFPEDSAQVLRSHKNLFAGGEKSVESFLIYRLMSRSGEMIWVKEYLHCEKDHSGERYHITGYLTDISAEKNSEGLLQEEVKKLKEQIASKDRFINILSHDLRAPFTSILGFSEILLNEPALSQKEKNEYLTYIYDASQNQLQFISYLLDWSRLRTGSLRIEPQRLNAAALVYNCVSSLTGNAIRKNIEIRVDVRSDLYIEADERLITQAIVNLLNNAIKFSYEESVIEIIAGTFNESQVEFIVKDNGVGIPQDEQQKLFNLEKNFSKEGTRGEKGSGFGLAFVKEIITNHSGDIWFYSEEGSGSEFHFTVPIPSNTMLIVLKDHAEAEHLEEAVKATFPDFTVFNAQNGYDAITIITDKHPNLVITDHNMPLMTGIQLIEAIKKGESGLKSPFVVLLDEVNSDTENKYFKLGVRHVLTKPYKNEQMVKALRSILA
ncbi:MAG: ATP-binding protein [Ignavibacteriaceae bacterium]|nr:ATP-binding protein [Ignavibacteriaceae bacterium]